MPYFALTYDVIDGFNDRKMPYRPQHLQLAREAKDRGELLLAGALGEPAGALLVFKADDRSTPENFAKADPYVTNGLVRSWAVRPWTVVIGNE
jgi:uncharacterized protein YciI